MMITKAAEKRIEHAWFKDGLDVEDIATNEGLPVYDIASYIMGLQDVIGTYRADSMHWQGREWWDSDLTPMVVALGYHKPEEE
jgi:hypothetical protein